MDLSFHRTGGLKPANAKPVATRAPAWPLLRAASAAAQAASPTALAVAGVLRGQEVEKDWIQELADILAPRSGGVVDTVHLSGSFNPNVAGDSGWDKEDEGNVYCGDLADLQG